MRNILAMTDCKSHACHKITCPVTYSSKTEVPQSVWVHRLSHLSMSSLWLCMAAPSSMPLAYRRTNWP